MLILLISAATINRSEIRTLRGGLASDYPESSSSRRQLRFPVLGTRLFTWPFWHDFLIAKHTKPHMISWFFAPQWKTFLGFFQNRLLNVFCPWAIFSIPMFLLMILFFSLLLIVFCFSFFFGLFLSFSWCYFL